MGFGALFVAVITMHSAVASRTREIATLRALGFRGGPVVISVLAESMILALVGGAIGAAVAYFGFNGYQAATMNWQNMSSIGFAFRVTPSLLGARRRLGAGARPARRPLPRHPGDATPDRHRAPRVVRTTNCELRTTN